jgi:ribosomal protein L18E
MTNGKGAEPAAVATLVVAWRTSTRAHGRVVRAGGDVMAQCH